MNIKSMTGFGKLQQTVGGKMINLEIKSVNSRYFDFAPHYSKIYNFMEDEVKKTVGSHISRGKVDLYLHIDFLETQAVEVVVNKPLLQSYLDAFENVHKDTDLRAISSVSEIYRLPDVFTVQSAELDEDALKSEILPLLDQMLAQYDQMRLTEGNRLAEDCLGKLGEIEAIVEQIKLLVPQSIAAYRERLEAKIREVVADREIDEGRVLTEVAVFSDKIAVDEEMVRLGSHIAQFRSMLEDASGPVGKKLDFLIQEMNREINTTGSKCNHVEITKLVIEVKSIIEKIREQIQNIE